MKQRWLKCMTFLVTSGLILTCMGCEKKKETDISTDIASVNNQMEEITNENSQESVGEYVVPKETDFYWEEVEGGVVITGYTGTDMTIQIPEQIGGLDVVEIGEEAFCGIELLGVKCPNTLKRINAKAFYYVTTLQELYLGDSTTVIGEAVCEGCLVLKKIVFNESLVEISARAFANCTSLQHILFPQSLMTVGHGAFVMSGLEEVTVIGSVKVVEKGAFQGCPKLKKVVIEEGVEIFEDDVFEGCDELEEVVMPASVSELGIWVFDQCPKLTVSVISGSATEAYVIENEINYQVR